ncbi:hypothetical protein IT408_02605 [Candidatus Uhrbacteria bacterium]|nr:hypothetical protein [Candidatus Uhrbacteria bacterium]
MGDKIKDILVGVIMIGLAGLGTIFPSPVPFVMYFVVLFSILFHGQLLGQRLFTRSGSISAVFAGSWVFLAFIALCQTTWFYLGGSLGKTSDALSLIFSIGLAQLFCLFLEKNEADYYPEKKNWKNGLLPLFLILLSIALSVSILLPAWRSGTTLSIRSPWPLLPIGSIAAFTCIYIVSLCARLFQLGRLVIFFLDAISLFSITAITSLIYRIGFGFDGFLHIASEKILLATGTLQPKPFYYIGQYVFTTWFSRLTDLPLATIDHWLVPLATAIGFSFILFLISSHISSYRFFPLALLPIGVFVTSTPQSFSYVLGFSALLLSLGTKNRYIHWLAPLSIGLWSIAVHPLAGIPFFFGSLAIIFCETKTSSIFHAWFRRIVFLGSSLLAGFSIPVLFYLLSIKQGTADNWQFSLLTTIQPWKDLFTQLIPSFTNYYVIWPAWSSFVQASIPLICLICGILSWLQARKQKEDEPNPSSGTIACLLIIGISLFVSYVILKSTGDFAFLIDYERGNYADRVFTLGVLFCLPAAAPWIGSRLSLLRVQPIFISLIVLLSYASVTGAMIYNALPRHDALITGRGWSTSQADMEAVRFIDRQAGKTPYAVLSNQSVSAAAVSQLGFKRYANNDIFFYPIPTGGPLYELFLRLTYRDQTLYPIKDAAQLTQSDEIYVIINDYWWNATILNEALRAIAQDHWTFGNPERGIGASVDVYRFSLKAASN